MPNIQPMNEVHTVCQSDGLVLQPIFSNDCYQFASTSFPDVVPESELQINTNSIYYTDPTLQLGSMPHMIMGYQSPNITSAQKQPTVLYKAVSMLQPPENSADNSPNSNFAVRLDKSVPVQRKQSQLKIIIIETNGSETNITGHLSNTNDPSASVISVEKDKTAKIILTELPNISVELPTKTTCEMVI